VVPRGKNFSLGPIFKNNAGQTDYPTKAKTSKMNYCRLDSRQLMYGITRSSDGMDKIVGEKINSGIDINDRSLDQCPLSLFIDELTTIYYFKVPEISGGKILLALQLLFFEQNYHFSKSVDVLPLTTPITDGRHRRQTLQSTIVLIIIS
uniref:Uncharacterized protein n=1 Tax=Romanomermis culicivorax TaxID=13658 RepID=A0A915HNL7_ROMCU